MPVVVNSTHASDHDSWTIRTESERTRALHIGACHSTHIRVSLNPGVLTSHSMQQYRQYSSLGSFMVREA